MELVILIQVYLWKLIQDVFMRPIFIQYKKEVQKVLDLFQEQSVMEETTDMEKLVQILYREFLEQQMKN